MNIWLLSIIPPADVGGRYAILNFLCYNEEAVRSAIYSFLRDHWEAKGLHAVEPLEGLELDEASRVFCNNTGYEIIYFQKGVHGAPGNPMIAGRPDEVHLDPARCEIVASALASFPYEDAGLILRNHIGVEADNDEDDINSGAEVINDLMSKFEV